MCFLFEVMADEGEAVPAHVPFHVAVRVPPPRCATDGLPPRLTPEDAGSWCKLNLIFDLPTYW